MGCVVSKKDLEKQEHLMANIATMHQELTKLKSYTDKLRYENILLREKIGMKDIQNRFDRDTKYNVQ